MCTAENRWRKRGIALVPSKFGLAFTFTTLNQVRSFADALLLRSFASLLTLFVVDRLAGDRFVGASSRALRSDLNVRVAALVHIYTDGSVLVNHGGIEMGQVATARPHPRNWFQCAAR